MEIHFEKLRPTKRGVIKIHPLKRYLLGPAIHTVAVDSEASYRLPFINKND